MIKAIIITGAAFTIGNIIWPVFDEPKLFYVPLAAFILLLLLFVTMKIKPEAVPLITIRIKNNTHLFFAWLVLLASGNIIKQIFYTENIKQINDYIFGGIVSIWLISNLMKNKFFKNAGP